MSLEAKIELLTHAIEQLTNALQNRQPLTVSAPVDPKAAYDAVKREHEAALRLTPEQQADVAKFETQGVTTIGIKISAEGGAGGNEPQPKSSPTTGTSLPSSQASVTYDDVKAVTIAVSKIDKAKAVAGLARFGAKNAKELQEVQWADYVVYMKRVAAGEIDPESSHE